MRRDARTLACCHWTRQPACRAGGCRVRDGQLRLRDVTVPGTRLGEVARTREDALRAPSRCFADRLLFSYSPAHADEAQSPRAHYPLKRADRRSRGERAVTGNRTSCLIKQTTRRAGFRAAG